MKAKLSTLARRLGELEIRNQHEVRVVAEAPVPNQPCLICQSTEHQGEHCPIVPLIRDMVAKQANAVGPYKPPSTVPYGNTYNLTGGTTLTSPGNQRLHHMCPLWFLFPTITTTILIPS